MDSALLGVPREFDGFRCFRSLHRRRVIAPVPPSGTHFLFRNRGYVDLRLQSVEDRSKSENMSRNRRRAGAATGVAFTGHLHKQIDTAAEIGLVAEVEFSSAIASLPA